MEISYAVSSVSLSESPIQEGWTQVQSALLSMSVADYESEFRADVDNGSCNNHSRRALCDHGSAFTLWQIHPSNGVRLTTNGSWIYDTNGLHGYDLVRSWESAARVAHHMMRQSLKTGSLCVYTHEPCNGVHPHSDYRLYKAKNYLKQHPFEEQL